MSDVVGALRTATPQGSHRKRLVIALALFGFLSTFIWSLVMPNLGGPDENLHLDLVYEMAHTGQYPLAESYRVHQQIGDIRALIVRDTKFGHNALASDAMPREDRPSFHGLPDARGSVNQLTQHPPAGWAVAVMGSAALRALSDPADWPYDQYLLLLRFLTALPMLAVGPLIMSSALRLGLAPRLAIVAAMLPFAVPQLTYDSGVITNDTMVVVVGSAFLWFVARVVTGDRARSTSVGLGVVLGLGMLTKAWGLLLLPTTAAVFGFVAWSCRSDRLAARNVLRRATEALAVASVVGGWWWIRNVIVSGEVQPHRAPLPDAPADFVPLSYRVWLPRVSGWLVHRFWGWFGQFAERVRIPTWAVVLASAVAVVLVLVALLRAGAQGVRIVAVAAVGLVTVNALEVLRQARALHVEHALMQGVQGRYLFVAVPMLSVVVAAGIGVIWRDRSRWLGIATLVAVAAMQFLALRAVMTTYWGAADAPWVDRLHAWASWAAPSPPAFVLLCVGVLVMMVWAVATIIRTTTVSDPGLRGKPGAEFATTTDVR